MLKTYLIVCAVIVLIGGIQGVIAGSRASIIAASAIAAFIVAGALLLNSKPTFGLVLALIGAAALAGRFVPAFLKAPDKLGALWPAGTMAVLGLVAVVWTITLLLRR